ncbi:OmpA family protein [Pseudomonas sp. 5P_3.1_Bac2]|uniref:OmpA family protein n=1 Tax=Pseudomonas sp. 5P_3.1_Bac2 TaxID=2971617 RepID=UPI0021C6B4CA|nr:OmpA family protein [Pseudomonas sp. 5P_3.1_Bac2]MCU1717533.1 OmpA family protein [Pseudomonas sp. 5P_3.1_Bac2]
MIHTLLASLLAILLLSGCQSTPPKALTAEQVQLLQNNGFHLTDEGWELNMSTKVLFAFDSPQLNSEITSQITQITQALLNVGIVGVLLEGHTDSSGSESYNEQLSLQRANSVADVMVSAGMQRDLIATRGAGSSKPIFSNNTPEGRSENRRVAIIISTEH